MTRMTEEMVWPIIKEMIDQRKTNDEIVSYFKSENVVRADGAPYHTSDISRIAISHNVRRKAKAKTETFAKSKLSELEQIMESNLSSELKQRVYFALKAMPK